MPFSLNYTDQQTLNPSAGVPAQHVYRLNGIRDPDFTGIGAQPAGFDQYAAIYNRYTVFAAEVEVYASTTNTSAITGRPIVMMHVSNKDVSSSGTNAEALVKADKLCLLAPVDAGPSNRVIRNRYTISSVTGRKFSVGDPAFSADVSADPDNGVYLVISVCGQNEVMDPDPVDVTLRIRYIGSFSEPKVLGES
jgi:hypothetical protein